MIKSNEDKENTSNKYEMNEKSRSTKRTIPISQKIA